MHGVAPPLPKRDPRPDLPPPEQALEFADLDAATTLRLGETALKADDIRTCVAAVVGTAIAERPQNISFVRRLLPRIEGLYAIVCVIAACREQATLIVEPLVQGPPLTAPQRAMLLCALDVADPEGAPALHHLLAPLRDDPDADAMTHAILDVAMHGSTNHFRGEQIEGALQRARTEAFDQLLVFETSPLVSTASPHGRRGAVSRGGSTPSRRPVTPSMGARAVDRVLYLAEIVCFGLSMLFGALEASARERLRARLEGHNGRRGSSPLAPLAGTKPLGSVRRTASRAGPMREQLH